MTETKPRTFKFDPSKMRVTVPTGSHVLAELEEIGVSYGDFASAIGLDAPNEEDFAMGRYVMPEELGDRIAAFLGWEPGSLNKIEASFQEAKAAGKEVLTASRETKSEKIFSGNLMVRVPSTLHKRLAGLAKKEGLSLNQLALSILAEGVGRLDRSA